jgi:hypothetical protein
MATIEEKMAELEASVAAKATELGASLDGIVSDIAAQAVEIAALKQAIIDGSSSPGELSPELVARFDALKSSLDTVAQKAADIDAALPAPTV